MQSKGNVNNIDKSVTKAGLTSLNGKYPTVSNRLGLFTFALTAGLLLTNSSTLAEHTLPAPAHPQLENTGRNVRDSGNATLTPEDQKETRGDINLTAAIRRKVVKNKRKN